MRPPVSWAMAAKPSLEANVSAVPRVVADDLVDLAPRHGRRVTRIAFEMVDEGDQRLPQPPAAATRPRVPIHIELGPERVAACAGEERPGDDRVARRIADAGRAEVEHRRQPPVADEQVPGGDVAVEP